MKFRNFVFPIEYRERANAFKQAKKENMSYYNYRDIRYKITEKQATYCWIYGNIGIVIGIAVGLSARIYCMNDYITIFIQALIGATVGVIVGAIGLRCFVKEANRSIDE